MKQVDLPSESGMAKKWFLLIVAVLFLVLVGGGGAVWAIKKKANQDDAESEVPKKAAAKNVPHEAIPIYVRLEPFTLKLQTEQPGQEQYLQLVPELRAIDLPAGEKIKAYLPQVRNDMLRLMSSRKASELSTAQGIEQLSIDLRNQTNQILGDARKPPPAGDKPGPDDPVRAVYFVSFIIQ